MLAFICGLPRLSTFGVAEKDSFERLKWDGRGTSYCGARADLRGENLLKVAVGGDLATILDELQAEVAHEPQEGGEVVCQLALGGGLPGAGAGRAQWRTQVRSQISKGAAYEDPVEGDGGVRFCIQWRTASICAWRNMPC